MYKSIFVVCLLSFSIGVHAQSFSTWNKEYEANKEFFKELERLSETAIQISNASKEVIKNRGFEKSRKQIEYYDEYERRFRDIYGATMVLTSTLILTLEQRGLEVPTLIFYAGQVCSYIPTIHVSSFRKPTNKELEFDQSIAIGWSGEAKADPNITMKILEGVKTAHKAKEYFFNTCMRIRDQNNWRR